MKYLFALITLSTLASCNLFYKAVFGIKDPKIENYHSINQYVKKFEIDSTSVVFTKDSASYFDLNRMFVGSPEIIIFNKSNKFIPYKSDSISCNASVDVVLKGICTIDSTKAIMHRQVDYKEFIDKLDDHNRTLASLTKDGYDFLVFVDFAKYFHKVNANHIPGWNKAIDSHYGTCKTKIIYVNLDYLDTWHISKNSLPTFKLSANKK